MEDDFTYGLIVVQGHGRLAGYTAAEAGMLRYGGLSEDEYFYPQARPRKAS